MIILIIHIIVSYDQNISLIFYVKYGTHVRFRHPSCAYITGVPPIDSTLQYKRCIHLWNNLPCIITLVKGQVFCFQFIYNYILKVTKLKKILLQTKYRVLHHSLHGNPLEITRTVPLIFGVPLTFFWSSNLIQFVNKTSKC